MRVIQARVNAQLTPPFVTPVSKTDTYGSASRSSREEADIHSSWRILVDHTLLQSAPNHLRRHEADAIW